MRPVPLHHRFALFRCPVCCGDLALVERRLACLKGHSFDLARSGYVNLMPAGRRAPAGGGDLRSQLEHRARFLARGHFDDVVHAIAEQAFDAEHVLEAGCGTGHHLAGLARRLLPQIVAGLDLSREAAAWCARRHPNFGFAVADLWRPWPVRDRSVDLVLNIFAPKNDVEMARVLRPGAWLALVFPGVGHLQELRAFGLLGSAADKAELYRNRLRRDFADTTQQRIVQRVTLERNAVIDAMLMGPSARHLARIATDRVPDQSAATIDLVLLLARRRSV